MQATIFNGHKLLIHGLFEWADLDSNQGPTDYESAALTN